MMTPSLQPALITKPPHNRALYSSPWSHTLRDTSSTPGTRTTTLYAVRPHSAPRRNPLLSRTPRGLYPPRPAPSPPHLARRTARHNTALGLATPGPPWRTRTTDDLRHQPPCMLESGACMTAQRGESLLPSLLACIVIAAIVLFSLRFGTITLKLSFFQKTKQNRAEEPEPPTPRHNAQGTQGLYEPPQSPHLLCVGSAV